MDVNVVMRFKEVEHKFLVDEAFDLVRFGEALAALGPTRLTRWQVRDRYFLTEDGRARAYVIRHRFDQGVHQLTIKSREADPEVRDEVNLDLGHHAGDQAEAVEAFVAKMGVSWSGTLTKDLRVWDFPDCEVVHYVASGDGRDVRCVEFEAIGASSVDQALAILQRYEAATGFAAASRSLQSLVELVFPNVFDVR